MKVQRGTRDNLEKHLDINQDIEVVLNVRGTLNYDYVCFGVKDNEKLSDDRYIIFIIKFNHRKLLLLIKPSMSVVILF